MTSIVRVNKSMKLRWVGHEARVEDSVFKLSAEMHLLKRIIGHPKNSIHERTIQVEIEEVGVNMKNLILFAQMIDHSIVLLTQN